MHDNIPNNINSAYAMNEWSKREKIRKDEEQRYKAKSEMAFNAQIEEVRLLKDALKKSEESRIQAEKELEVSHKYNKWMMVISVVSMAAAIAGLIFTIWG